MTFPILARRIRGRTLPPPPDARLPLLSIDGLPGAGAIIKYDDVRSGGVSGQGDYQFSDSSSYTSAGLTDWNEVKDADYLFVHDTDADGTDQSDYYAQIQVGDLVVNFVSDDQWASYSVTSIDDSSDIYRFGIDLDDFHEFTFNDLDDGDITFRWSKVGNKGR